MKKRVALIFGGEGRERGISELSAKNLSALLDREIYETLPIGITELGEWFIYCGDIDKLSGGEWQKDKTFLKRTHPVYSGFQSDGCIIRVDAAILCMHGDKGEDGTIAGALSTAHIKYVGEDVYSSAVTQDKAYTKCIAKSLGIPTAKWLLSTGEAVSFAKRRAEALLSYPMFLKPARLGSSYGAHPIMNASEFAAAFTDAKSFDERIIIEERIDVAFEAECAFFSDGEERRFSVGRIDSGGAFYDFDAKYNGANSLTINNSLDSEEMRKEITEYSARLAEYVGLSHIGRIDFLVDKGRRVFFNEINAFPGMTKTSLYPLLTEAMGFSEGEFIGRLIESVCRNDWRV